MKKYLLMMLTTGAVAVIPLIYISEATAAPTASPSVDDTVSNDQNLWMALGLVT